jgi:hypothetical protein
MTGDGPGFGQGIEVSHVLVVGPGGPLNSTASAFRESELARTGLCAQQELNRSWKATDFQQLSSRVELTSG